MSLLFDIVQESTSTPQNIMGIKDWLLERKENVPWQSANYNRKTSTVSLDESDTEKNAATQDVREISSVTSSSAISEGEDHIFKDPKIAEHYRKKYEEVNYECKDYFDPDFTYTAEEERKVVWKCDWRVTFWAYVMFVALGFDRVNINQALADNFLDDLGMTTNDYNVGRTINLICFLGAELPSQLVSKKLGADIWIPIQMIIWSLVTTSQAGLTSKAGFFVTRGLLGLFQGGFICDTCLWLSYFYTGRELPFRLSLFYIANPFTSIFSALLGFAILRIQTSLLPHGWQWVFLLEGIATMLIGIASFFMMPASAVQTRTWYRPKGWFTEREEKIVVNRVLRDDPSKGDMNNREPVSFRELLRAITDYDLLPIYIVRFLGDLCIAPVQAYLTLTLRKLGFNPFNTNLLTIPSGVLTILSMLAFSWFSEKFKSRALMMATIPLHALILLIPLRWWSGSQIDVWPTFAILTLLLGYAPAWPLSISWCSSNSNSVRNRAVSSAIVNIFSQASGIVGSNIYRADDFPLYHRGNRDLVIISAFGVGFTVFSRQYYIFRNNQKIKKWNAMSLEEQDAYLHDSKHDSNKRLDFRFVY